MSLLTQQLKRVHFEQVFVPKEGGCFIFPIANGDYNQPPGVDTKPVRDTGKILPLLVRDAGFSDALAPDLAQTRTVVLSHNLSRRFLPPLRRTEGPGPTTGPLAVSTS